MTYVTWHTFLVCIHTCIHINISVDRILIHTRKYTWTRVYICRISKVDNYCSLSTYVHDFKKCTYIYSQDFYTPDQKIEVWKPLLQAYPVFVSVCCLHCGVIRPYRRASAHQLEQGNIRQLTLREVDRACLVRLAFTHKPMLLPVVAGSVAVCRAPRLSPVSRCKWPFSNHCSSFLVENVLVSTPRLVQCLVVARCFHRMPVRASLVCACADTDLVPSRVSGRLVQYATSQFFKWFCTSFHGTNARGS